MAESIDLLADADLGAAVRELYAGDPAGFVARRTALQREVRASGRRELARTIGGLRKPTVAEHAWNRLARSADGPLLADVRDRHEEATAAQAAAITGDVAARRSLRAVTTAARAARSTAVSAARRGIGAAADDPRAATVDAVLQRVMDTGRWDQLLAGVLGADGAAGAAGAELADETVFRGIAPDATIPPPPTGLRKRGKAMTRGGEPEVFTQTAETAQREEAEEAEEAAEEARRAEVAAADEAVRAAAAALAAARTALDDAAARLDAATAAHRSARQAVRDAEREHDAAVLGREGLASRGPARRRRP